jgi:hypothetical protein
LGLAQTPGAAYARGGGYGGSLGHPIMSSPGLATAHSPGLNLPGAHLGPALSGLVQTPGAAYARGGGYGGSLGHPIMSSPGLATAHSPGLNLPGVHLGPALPGATPHQFAPTGASRAPAGAIMPPASGGKSQPTQARGAMGGNIASSRAAAALTNFGFGVGTIPIPPAPAPTPPPEIAAPAPELAPIAPLSPQLDTQFSTGGVVQQPNMALSPGASPSMPGGGGDTLADCMGMWDAGTHMSTVEWREACARTLNGLDVPVDSPPTASANRKRERLTHHNGKAGSSNRQL